MKRFAQLYLELDATNSTNEKVALVEAYLRQSRDEEAAWAVALLLGERPKGGASTKALRALILRETGYPEWLVGECSSAVGDFSETAALLAAPIGATDSLEEPLDQTMRRRVVPLAGSTETEREKIILDAWRAFGPRERFVYHKLARGGFRVGVQKRLVARALARVAGVDTNEMMLRLTGTVNPEPDWFRALLEGTGDRLESAYPFYLAHQLGGAPDTLTPPSNWHVEWKWDGIRAQLVRRASVLLWSRGEEPITHQFPEFAAAGRHLPEGTVLDGEVLMWRNDAPNAVSGVIGRPLPFAKLQTRLGRKVAPTLQGNLFDRDECVFLAFDLLEHQGVDIRRRPLAERRALLEQLLSRIQNTGAGDTIRLSPALPATTWNDLANRRAESRARGVEGLMLKRLDAPYGIGRTKGDADQIGWWKWKIDPHAIDAVLVYAQPGSGRRAGLLTDYTFAVWDRSGNAPELRPFAKAYSGLTNDEIEALDAWIRSHTTGRSGPVRRVEPTRVFEIHFEGIAESARHASGVAVRFPRIARERTDKTPDQANTLADLHTLRRENQT